MLCQGYLSSQGILMLCQGYLTSQGMQMLCQGWFFCLESVVLNKRDYGEQNQYYKKVIKIIKNLLNSI